MDEILSRLKQSRNAVNIKRIASDCLEDPEGFESLIALTGGKDQRIASLAAWAMSHAVGLDKTILKLPHHKKLLAIITKTGNNAVKRNIMRAWQWVKLPQELVPDIADIAFRLFSNPAEDIAVKVFSMTVLESCLQFIPEMKEEVLFIIEKDLPHGTAAYQVRAARFMQAAAKI